MTVRLWTLALVAATTLALPNPVSAATTWRVDPAHSTAEFTVRHLLLSNVRGTIPVKSGEIETGSTTLPLSVEASLDPAALNTRSDDRDNDLRGPRWLDVAKYPTITFVSTKITGAPDAFTIVGDLTIHGVTKSVTLAAKALGVLTDQRGNQHIGYEASTSLERTDYGLTFMGSSGGALIAGTTVTITIELEAISRPG